MSTKCIDNKTFKLKLQELRPDCFNTDNVKYKNKETEVELTCLRCVLNFNLKPYIIFGKKKECCPKCNLTFPKKKRQNIYTLLDYIKICKDFEIEYLSDFIPKNISTPG